MLETFDSNIDSLQLLSVWDTLKFCYLIILIKIYEIWYIVKTVCVVLLNVCLVLRTGKNTENRIIKAVWGENVNRNVNTKCESPFFYIIMSFYFTF